MTNGEAGGCAADPAPAAEAVRAALGRVVASPEFAGSPRLQRFLAHVVDAALAARPADLRAYPIAVDVFDRPHDFDPQTDSLVRVEAGRLRQKLEAYYAGSGMDDPLRIGLPKGGYAPRFEARAPTGATTALPPATAAARHGGRWLAAAAGVALVLAVGSSGFLFFDRQASVESEPVAAAAGPVPQVAPALAVLPFQALDPAPATTQLTATVASGLTALVTADLVRFRQFFVLAGRSAAALALGGGDPIAGALEGGLDYVVDGTVRREAEDFVVTASLIATRDGRLFRLLEPAARADRRPARRPRPRRTEGQLALPDGCPVRPRASRRRRPGRRGRRSPGSGLHSRRWRRGGDPRGRCGGGAGLLRPRRAGP